MEAKLAAKHLVVAARLGDKAAIERLVQQQPGAVAGTTEDGLTALQVACSLGNVDIVQCLLDAGALTVLDTPSRGTSMTPLMLAACGGHTHIITMLMTAGADSSSTDKNGWTALHHAAFKGKGAALEALIQDGTTVDSMSLKNETPLALAAVMEQEEACRTLVAHGANAELLAAESDRAFVTAVASGPAPTMRSRSRAASASKGGSLTEINSEYSFDSVIGEAGNGRTTQQPPRIQGPDPGLMASRRSRRGSAPNSASIHMSLSDIRSAPYAIVLPSGPRKATPMYVPHSGATTTTNHPSILTALELWNRKDSEWVLQAFSYRGAAEGFLLDKDTGLVYWIEGQAAGTATGSSGGSSGNANGLAGAPARALRPQLPQLVGKMLPGVGGLMSPSLGQILPLTASDLATLELSAPAMRCIRRQSPAAALLMNAAKRGDPVLADLAPELGGAAFCRGVSLAAPLCAVLGVHEVSDLSLLTPKELAMVDVDADFLPTLLDLGDSSTPRPGETGSPRSGADSGSPHSTGGSSHGLPVLPTLSQLLVKHGLAKLIPVAADRKLLSTSEVHHWGELSGAAAGLSLSAPELGRLKALIKSIGRAQDQALALQASRLELLSRLTVGSLVVYEADPLRVAARGERLAGIILEDLGSEAVTSVTGTQYKVRDLLDDTLVWQSPGQVHRLTPVEAYSLLRADLLPPTSPGAPVTPLSAAAGLRVQLAPWSRSTAMLDEYQASGIATEPTLEGGKGGPGDDEPTRAMMQVIGELKEPVSEDRQVWSVLWPDGLTRTHMVGANGRFELVHIHLHRLAGAPLTRSHFKLLLGAKDMMAVPLVRSPLWPRSSTDDSVPGSPGLGFLDAAQAAVAVVWSRSREQASSLYCPDAQGVYPLCHGLLGSSGLSCLAAKPGVLVEAAPGAPPAVVAASAQGPGSLLAPVSFNSVSGKVTWRVRWQSGSVTMHDLGTDLSDTELQVSEAYTVGSSDRVVLLNEVSKRAVKTAPATAALASVAKAVGSACGCGCGGAGACRRVAGLGRPLFAKDPARAHTWGMLGSLVKLNLAAIGLQPGCEQGPLCSYEPRLLSESLAAKKEGIELGPIPRDDVGIVVKDAGPGAWRSLLVRKLGSTASFWYDESVILPATAEDVKRQVLRCGPSYMFPRHLQGVPVTDANAAPGMLVQRAYAAGAAQEGGDRAQTIGELIRPAGAHAWQVAWPDGSMGTYKTGATNKFQLCFVNLHDLAGSPLLATTVTALAAGGAGPIPVIDGPHSATEGLKPGTVRFVNDPLTQQGLLLQEVAQLQATGMVATSAGERCMGGGPLRLYELSHAVVPGDAVTVFTAKRGLRVMLTVPDDENKDERAAVFVPRGGVLRGPTRLAVRAVLDAGSGAGSGMPGGPTASREAVLLQDPAVVYWEVEWDNGRIEEVLVGTTPGQTPLRVAGSPSESEEAEDAGDAGEHIHSYEKVAKTQHFVRMLEPVMLLPCSDADMTWALERTAQPLQRAVGWSNQMMRELCGVWWAAARLAAAASEAAEQASGEGGEGEQKQLWRPHLSRVAAQTDLLTFAIKKRAGGVLRWETLLFDAENEVSSRVPPQLDERLALAADMINRNLLRAGGDSSSSCSEEEAENVNALNMTSRPTPSAARHLVLDSSSRLIDTTLVLNELGRPEPTSESVEEVLTVANGAIIDFRSALVGEQDPEAGPDLDSDQFDLVLGLEPSMSADKAPLGGCMVLHMAREVPPPLEVSSEEGAEDGAVPEEKEGNGPWAVGPLAMLATGCLPVLQGSVLQAHRALGALSAGPCSTLMAGFNTTRGRRAKEGEVLALVGRVQYCMWLDVPERPFPLDVGQARCLATVNSQLFTLRRVCASLNSVPGGGTANVSEMLMSVLRVVREKAAAALALEASKNLMEKANSAHATAKEHIDEQREGASDILSFDSAKQDALLAAVTQAMQRLVLAEAFAHKACSYAEAAQPPLATPAIEKRERAEAAEAQQSSRKCLAETIEQYNYLYPDIIEAVKTGALSLTRVMRDKQLKANDLYSAAKQAQVELVDAKKAMDVAERTARTADDDLSSARQQQERKKEDLEKYIKQKESAASSLMEEEGKLQAARAELLQVGLPSDPAASEQEGEAGVPAPPSSQRVAAESKVSSAEASVGEVRDRVAKFKAFVESSDADHQRAIAATHDAEVVLDNKREAAAAAKNTVAAAQARLNASTRELRSLDPESLNLNDERIKKLPAHERMARQVVVARRTAVTAQASLGALQQMLADIPPCMFAPEAVARLLSRSVSALTLLAATAAAECARTSTLTLEEFLLDLEDREAAAATFAGMGLAGLGGTLAASGVATRGNATAGSTMASGGAISNGLPPPQLPSIDEVYRLMGVIRNDVLVSVKQFAELAPHVPDETTITDEPELGSLNRSVLSAVVDRAMLTAATTLEKLGQAAAANVTGAISEAAAAVENAKQAGVTQGGGPAPSTTDALPRALHAARVATLVAETARALPSSSADMPVSDQKLAMTLVSLARSAQNANNVAVKESTKLSNELVVKLSKSGLGAAATSSSVLCTVYSELACKAESIIESQYWCNEAAGLFPKVRAAADAAIFALIPAPPASVVEEEGEGEGEEAPEKKKEDPAELAAKIAAAAEAERVINRYVSEVALKLASAAVDWAQKLMSPLSDSSSIEEITEDTAAAVAAQDMARHQQEAESTGAGSVAEDLYQEQSLENAGVSQSGAAPQQRAPAQPPVHPDSVVAIIRGLAEPLRIADLAFRQAGNHTGLDDIDSTLKDVLSTVAEGAKTRAEVNGNTLEEITSKLKWMQEDCETSGQSLSSVKLRAMRLHAAGLVSCAEEATQAARHLVTLVPLVLPRDKVSRCLKEASACCEGLEEGAASFCDLVTRELERLTGDVTTAMTSTEALMEALEPSFTQLEVRLDATASTAARPASPSRLRGTRKGPPAPPTLSLQLAVPAPSERYTDICSRVTERVFHQPTVRALLAPYHALLQAANEAACSVHTAAAAEPTDAEIESLLNPGSLAAARTLNHTSGNHFVTSTNMLQLKRWGAAVATMSQATSLVLRGFIEATEQSHTELAPLELLWMI